MPQPTVHSGSAARTHRHALPLQKDVALQEGDELWVSARSGNFTVLADLLGVEQAGPHLRPTKDALKSLLVRGGRGPWGRMAEARH